MINFFRRIRQKLADDNKPLKYIRYAVGEIVLVVIGILIALAINNQNEQRNERKLEQIILKQLKEDYKANILQLENKIEMREVKVGPRISDFWVIAEGLSVGEKVVYEGLQKVNEGSVVKPEIKDIKPTDL